MSREFPQHSPRRATLEEVLEAARIGIMGRTGSVPMQSLSRSEVSFVHTVLARHYDVKVEREHTEYPGYTTTRPGTMAPRARQPWTVFRLLLRPRPRKTRPRVDPVVDLYRALPHHVWSRSQAWKS